MIHNKLHPLRCIWSGGFEAVDLLYHTYYGWALSFLVPIYLILRVSSLLQCDAQDGGQEAARTLDRCFSHVPSFYISKLLVRKVLGIIESSSPSNEGQVTCLCLTMTMSCVGLRWLRQMDVLFE